MNKHLLSHEKDHLRKPRDMNRRRIGKKSGKPYEVKIRECPICQKPVRGMLTKHIRTHDPNHGLDCPYCELRYRAELNRKVHIVKCHSEFYESPDIYICSECKLRHNSPDELVVHLKEAHQRTDNEKKELEYNEHDDNDESDESREGSSSEESADMELI